ncbi:MAG: heavy-metal-associated domain-containing protein [Pseudomonadota bacterium]
MVIADTERHTGLSSTEAGMRTEQFLVQGVRCGSCVGKIEAALLSEPRIKSAVIGGDRRSLTITHSLDDPLADLNALLALLGSYRAEERSLIRLLFAKIVHYRPLIVMTCLVVFFGLALQALRGWHGHGLMGDLMAGYFLLFGALKVANRKVFSRAYARYDLLASRSAAYAATYPFLEVSIGVLYLISPEFLLLNLFVAALMLEKAWSVHRALARGQNLQCACLGGFFSIPISNVTVFEDLLMALMAGAMIVGLS